MQITPINANNKYSKQQIDKQIYLIKKFEIIMKRRFLLIAALPALLLACGKPTTDDASDAGGTASPFLAREVVGTRMLTEDANYDKPCNYIAQEFIRATFKLGIDVHLTEFDHPNGCEFHWDNNKVGLFFGGSKPFTSMYHAEYAFDKQYQPRQAALTTGQSAKGEQRSSQSGPAPEGTVSEVPAITHEGGTKRDTSAANDTALTSSRIPPRAAMFTEPAQSQGRFVAVKGIGDKAVWEPANHTMHVLFNNHIINVQVQSGDQPQVLKERATTLANIILDNLLH